MITDSERLKTIRQARVTKLGGARMVRFLLDDPGGLWRKGDIATDLGWESVLPEGDPDFAPIRLLRTAAGQVLSITDPFVRGVASVENSISLTTCMMADCEELPAHLCVQHVLEVHCPTLDSLTRARQDAFDEAVMIVHEVRRQTLSDSGDEIVRHDRLRVVQALEAARDKEK